MGTPRREGVPQPHSGPSLHLGGCGEGRVCYKHAGGHRDPRATGSDHARSSRSGLSRVAAAESGPTSRALGIAPRTAGLSPFQETRLRKLPVCQEAVEEDRNGRRPVTVTGGAGLALEVTEGEVLSPSSRYSKPQTQSR